jgi:TRAP-type C4-dicarboxylate transport system substrate-binding protein
MGDTYDSLSRGVVDGSMSPMEALEGWKWGEVVKYTSESFGAAYSTGFFVVMNKEKWNSLPPAVQKVIEQVNKEWIEKTGRLWEAIDKSGRDYSLKRGNEIILLPKEEDERWARAVRPILDDYVASMKEKGLPGEEALKFSVSQLKKLQ